MALIQTVSAHTFINRLTANKLNEKQVNRAVAFLKAKKIAFRDEWDGKYCLIQSELLQNKTLVIEALKVTLKVS